MQKWRRGYLSSIKYKIKEDSGITLVELLAVLVMLSVVVLLIGSIHIFAQKQFKAQTESASQNNGISYALTIMSTELRGNTWSNVKAEDDLIEITGISRYEVKDQKLIKNDNEILAKGIKEMKIDKDNEKIEINIISLDITAGNQVKDYHTTIYFRGELSE